MLSMILRMLRRIQFGLQKMLLDGARMAMQLMLRNISGVGGFDRNKICIQAGGFSDTTIGLMGAPSRGSDIWLNNV